MRPLNTVASHAIEINIFHSEQNFQIEWTYDPGYFTKSTILNLIKNYQDQLESVVNDMKSVHSPLAQFSLDRLTMSDLESIERQLK